MKEIGSTIIARPNLGVVQKKQIEIIKDKRVVNIGTAVENYVLDTVRSEFSAKHIPKNEVAYDVSTRKTILSYLLPKNRQSVRVKVAINDSMGESVHKFKENIAKLVEHIEPRGDVEFLKSINNVENFKKLANVVKKFMAI